MLTKKKTSIKRTHFEHFLTIFVCNLCNTPATINHILCVCPLSAVERQSLKCLTDDLDSQPFSEEKLLGAWKRVDHAQRSLKGLLAFLSKTGLDSRL